MAPSASPGGSLVRTDMAPSASPGGSLVRTDMAVAPPLYPLLAPIAAVVVTVLTTYASTRFRTTAEPVFVVLAALALDSLWGYVSARN